jgi:hypothetical protein
MRDEGTAGPGAVRVSRNDITTEMLTEAARHVDAQQAYEQMGRCLGLNEVLRHDGLEFVRLAYGLVLRRQPTLAELNGGLMRLSAGLAPVEFLRRLRFSREAWSPLRPIRDGGQLWRAQMAHLFPRLFGAARRAT